MWTSGCSKRRRTIVGLIRRENTALTAYQFGTLLSCCRKRDAQTARFGRKSVSLLFWPVLRADLGLYLFGLLKQQAL